MDDTKKTEAVKVLGRVCQGVALVLMITAIPLMARDGSETLALQVLVTALALLAAGILTSRFPTAPEQAVGVSGSK